MSNSNNFCVFGRLVPTLSVLDALPFRYYETFWRFAFKRDCISAASDIAATITRHRVSYEPYDLNVSGSMTSTSAMQNARGIALSPPSLHFLYFNLNFTPLSWTPSMSALGQKRTWDCRPLTSTLPPKAYIHPPNSMSALCQKRTKCSATKQRFTQSPRRRRQAARTAP
jgi:hypothetical protein